MSWHQAVASKLRELRFICSFSPDSSGCRAFISSNYSQVKQAAPQFPFIVRECENAIPMAIARYDFGVERKVPLDNLPEAEVAKAVQELVEQADSINTHRFLSH